MDHTTTAKVVAGGSLACLSYLFGVMDFALQLLLILMVSDYVFGMAKALKKRKFDYSVGAWGIGKKIGILIFIAIVVRLDLMVGAGGILRLGAIYAYAANESASVIKNAKSIGIYVPNIIGKYFGELDELPTKRRA